GKSSNQNLRGPNLAVRHHCVVELRHSMRVAKRVVGAERCLRKRGTCIQRYITIELILQARRRHNGIKQPLWPQFPAKTCGRNDWILSFHVDAHAEDELHVRTENVRASDNERHVEIIPKQMTQA